ncbi:MAG: hypothetical protein IKY83_10475, partial [Proteobacteria bacterium]|nr:hypothetical protein [Pseudomonadota bacterium]
ACIEKCGIGETLDETSNKCLCDTDNHWDGIPGGCSCANGYQLNAENSACEEILCNTGEKYDLAQKECICDTANHWESDNAKGCKCMSGYKQTENACDAIQCGVGEIFDSQKQNCVCDTANFWELKENNQCGCMNNYEFDEAHNACKSIQCKSNREIVVNNVCVCDSERHWVEKDGNCDCAPGYTLINDNTCTPIECNKEREKLDIDKNECICDHDRHWTGETNNCVCENKYELNNTKTECISFTCATGEIYYEAGNTCICDKDNHWEGTRGNCDCEKGFEKNKQGDACVAITCGVGQIFDEKTKTCICDTENHWTQSGNGCKCADGFVNNNGICRCNKQAPSNLGLGNTITFGSYYQSNNTSKEAITWKVMDVDTTQCRVLLISDKVLEKRYYIGAGESKKDVTWKDCDIRSWLNGYGANENRAHNDYTKNSFLSTAFTSDEQKHILSVELENANNPTHGTSGGDKTTDRIFILSYNEVEKYYKNNAARKCTITAYAKNTGEKDTSGYCPCHIYCSYCNEFNSWWLRTPGDSEDKAMFINAKDGDYYNNKGGFPVCNGTPGVRPALWYDYSN